MRNLVSWLPSINDVIEGIASAWKGSAHVGQSLNGGDQNRGKIYMDSGFNGLPVYIALDLVSCQNLSNGTSP